MDFCMLCNGDSHTNHENMKPKISSFCLQPVMANGTIFWRNSTDTKKKKDFITIRKINKIKAGTKGNI